MKARTNISNHTPENKKTVCEVCRTEVHYVFVHGHYQCPNCKQVIVTCCEAGENNCADNTKNN